MIRAEPDLWICVQNRENRWSVWPTDLPIPAGWTAESKPASRDDCLAVIEAEWTDFRPNALRKVMA